MRHKDTYHQHLHFVTVIKNAIILKWMHFIHIVGLIVYPRPSPLPYLIKAVCIFKGPSLTNVLIWSAYWASSCGSTSWYGLSIAGWRDNLGGGILGGGITSQAQGIFVSAGKVKKRDWRKEYNNYIYSQTLKSLSVNTLVLQTGYLEIVQVSVCSFSWEGSAHHFRH